MYVSLKQLLTDTSVTLGHLLSSVPSVFNRAFCRRLDFTRAQGLHTAYKNSAIQSYLGGALKYCFSYVILCYIVFIYIYIYIYIDSSDNYVLCDFGPNWVVGGP